MPKINPEITKAVLRSMLGAGAGAGYGYFLTPYMFGYEKDPIARRVSALSDAVAWAILGAMGPKEISKMWKNLKGTSKFLAPAGALVGPEIFPMGSQFLHQSTNAANIFANSVAQLPVVLKESQPPTVLEQLTSVLTSPISKGFGLGGLAGTLLGGAVGTLRPLSLSEIESGQNRYNAAIKDAILYGLVGALAGTIGGAALNKSRSANNAKRTKALVALALADKLQNRSIPKPAMPIMQQQPAMPVIQQQPIMPPMESNIDIGLDDFSDDMDFS